MQQVSNTKVQTEDASLTGGLLVTGKWATKHATPAWYSSMIPWAPRLFHRHLKASQKQKHDDETGLQWPKHQTIKSLAGLAMLLYAMLPLSEGLSTKFWTTTHDRRESSSTSSSWKGFNLQKLHYYETHNLRMRTPLMSFPLVMLTWNKDEYPNDTRMHCNAVQMCAILHAASRFLWQCPAVLKLTGQHRGYSKQSTKAWVMFVLCWPLTNVYLWWTHPNIPQLSPTLMQGFDITQILAICKKQQSNGITALSSLCSASALSAPPGTLSLPR